MSSTLITGPLFASLLIYSYMNYLLKEHSKRGFFARFHSVLEHLHKYESKAQGFHVSWAGPYGAWDQYFDSLGEFDPNATVIDEGGRMLKVPDRRRVYYDLIKKYIKIKPHILDKVNAFLDLHSGKHLLGIHLRLTDKSAQGAQPEHCGFPIRKSYYLRFANRYLTANPEAYIYVATDSHPAINAFQKQYGSRVLFYDCLRSPDATSIHGNYDKGIPGDAYKKGDDALIEALILSRCNFLIHSLSNLSLAAGRFNPELRALELLVDRHGSLSVTTTGGNYLIGHRHAGLFSNVFTVLGHAKYAVDKGLTPAVFWEQEGVDGWTNLFEPLSDLEPSKEDVPNTLMLSDGQATEYHPPDGYGIGYEPRGSHHLDWRKLHYPSKEDRQEVGLLFNRFLKVKPHILQEVEEYANKHFTSRTIGIYLRGTDIAGEWQWPYEDILKAAANEQGLCFVATEDEGILKLAQRYLGDRMIYRDAVRGTSSDLPWNRKDKDQNKLDHDFMVDTLLMSRCDVYYHGRSNLGVAPIYFNTELENYCFPQTSRPRIKRVPQQFMPNIRDRRPRWCDGICAETYFLQYFLKHKPELDQVYLPILWTPCYLQQGQYEFHKQQQIEKWLDCLNPNRQYFTVVQNDEGILEKIPPNVLVFGAGGEGDIPIPLLGTDLMPHRQTVDRNLLVTFVGNVHGTHNLTGLRGKMIQALQHQNECRLITSSKYPFYQFASIANRSVFSLCPRGFGRSSFRLYETMGLGSIPVYIWDDKEWLPYQDKFDWDEFSVRINIKDIDALMDRLRSYSEQDIKRMRQRMDELYPQYFVRDGVCKYIVDYLK